MQLKPKRHGDLDLDLHDRDMTQRRWIRRRQPQPQPPGSPRDRKLEERWQRRLDAGEEILCWRCRLHGRRTPVDPQQWELGRDPEQPRQARGPECLDCASAES